MKSNPRWIVPLLVGGLAIAMCVFLVPPLLSNFGANATPTITHTPIKPKFIPTKTPVPRRSPTPSLVVFTETPMPPLSLPSPFDIILNFTNGSCGTGTPSYSYTFTIEGTSLTLDQTDAGLTTIGAYNPATDAFSASGDVGAGIETYDGTISYDGTTITVAGEYSWTPDGGSTCTFSVAGTTTP